MFLSYVFYFCGHLATLPNQQRWRAKTEAQSECVHVVHTFLHVLAPTCVLRRCLVTKISASEIRRTFIKSALLVGQEEEGGGSARFFYFLLARARRDVSPAPLPIWGCHKFCTSAYSQLCLLTKFLGTEVLPNL